MWVKIAEQWVGDAPQTFRPCFQTCGAVDAYAQDLGADPIEPVKINLVGWNLAGSYRRPGKWKKCQYHIAFTDIITQADGLPEMAFKTKFRCKITNC